MMGSTIQAAVDCHRQGRLAEAERLYRSVLSQEPEQFEALHLLGLLKLQEGNPSEAHALISAALRCRPGATNAMCNLSAALLGLNRAAEALATCDQVLSITPADEEARYNRAAALFQLGRYPEAIEGFNGVLAARPRHLNALFNRGNALAGLKRFAEAVSSYDEALSVRPQFLPAVLNRGNALLKLERFEEALNAYDKVLAQAPGQAEALNGRAICLKELKRFDEALGGCEQVLIGNPDHVSALNTKGNTLLELHRPLDALAAFERALATAPNDANLLTNRAFALHALGRHQEALDDCNRALGIDPAFANALLMRGHALTKLDRPDEAAASYEQLMSIRPDDRYAFAPALMSHLTACNWDKVDGMLATVRQHISAGKFVIPPFNIFGLPLEPSYHLQCSRNFIRHRVPFAPQPFPQRARKPSGKIRLAYLSGDYRRHPLSYLMSELFERHDRARFEIIGVSYGPDDGSAERSRLVKAFDRFLDVSLHGDRDVASLIDEHQVDIAVDLAGHTETSRPAILAHRPAPIQVSYMGYCGTIGADFIDYILADEIVLPFDQQPYYTENIVHLPDCYWVTDSQREIAEAAPSRRDAGLPDEGFVFCCFNNSYKITSEFFDVWMRLLAERPGSVLWLLRDNAAAERNLRRQAQARGVDGSRLVFADRVTLEEHLPRQRLADLFLDTLPVNAHTTASDALRVGLPVVTCPGQTFAGRVAASILRAAGVPELIAGNLEEYEDLARTLSAEASLLQSLRQRLVQNRQTHPLFDTDRFRRHMERAYSTMWEIFQRGDRPRSFTVDAIETTPEDARTLP